jgi:hypothetical protein
MFVMEEEFSDSERLIYESIVRLLNCELIVILDYLSFNNYQKPTHGLDLSCETAMAEKNILSLSVYSVPKQ